MSKFAVPAHIKAISNATPLLTEAEEIAAVERGDRDLLCRAHFRLVISIAWKFKGYIKDWDERFAIGCQGLAEAARRFKLGKGARFGTYAVWWIRAALQEYVLANASLVKMGTTAAGKKLFFKQSDINNGTAEEVADRYGVTVEDVEMMRGRGQDYSLNAPAHVSGDEDSGTEWIDYLQDAAPNQGEVFEEEQEQAQQKAALEKALRVLTDRERTIFLARVGHGGKTRDRPVEGTLEFLSKQFGISRERVRQIEVRATEKIKEELGLLPKRPRRPVRRRRAPRPNPTPRFERQQDIRSQQTVDNEALAMVPA